MKVIHMILLAALAVSLPACKPPSPGEAAGPEQKALCEVTDWRQAHGTCKEGSVLAYLPGSWGNDQLPIVAAAINCDFRYPIVYNNGGVTCIYTARRKPEPAAVKQQ